MNAPLPRQWDSLRQNRGRRLERAASLGLAGKNGKEIPVARIIDLLEAVIQPGDRVCLEGNNQKQADFLARALTAIRLSVPPVSVVTAKLGIVAAPRPTSGWVARRRCRTAANASSAPVKSNAAPNSRSPAPLASSSPSTSAASVVPISANPTASNGGGAARRWGT